MQETRNIKLVAYLRLMGIFPVEVEKLSRGKAKYKFDMTNAEWIKHKLEFDRSDFIKYAQCMDAVTDLAY